MVVARFGAVHVEAESARANVNVRGRCKAGLVTVRQRLTASITRQFAYRNGFAALVQRFR